MTIQNFLRNRLILIFPLAMFSTNVFAADDMRWFTNETVCDEVKITVLSYCQNDVDEMVNTFCVQQKLILEKNEKKIMLENLLEKEPSRNEFHSVRSLTCVAGKNNKPYIFFSLGNGGNCNDCEVHATMDLNGRWKHYDRKWFVSGRERKDIDRQEKVWWKEDSFYLKNKIENVEK